MRYNEIFAVKRKQIEPQAIMLSSGYVIAIIVISNSYHRDIPVQSEDRTTYCINPESLS